MRRSISGPLIVISIGVLFLINNFYPDVFSWRILFHLWPFLLIGLGVIRLIEVLVDAGRARPLPPAHFSGGGIVLVVLACFLFWGISKGARSHHWPAAPFVHMDASSVFGEQFDFDIKQTLPVNAADARLVLDDVRGSVTVSGDDSAVVTVTGRKTSGPLAATGPIKPIIGRRSR